MESNPIYWWELASHDAENTVNFLKGVFGWDIRFDSDVGFFTVPADRSHSDLQGGFVFTLRKAKLPFLTLYIKVEDIFAKAKQVEEAGGHIVEAPFDIGSGSYICLFNEPSGVTLAMIQPAARETNQS
jgi:predicted enzyme related to lactoylglutathione lyase